MDITDLTHKEILSFMLEENIPITDLRFNGEDHYKPDGILSAENKEKLTQKLLELSRFENKIDMLIKHHYGSYEKLDKQTGVSGHRAKFQRWIKHSKEMAKIIRSKPNINSL